MGLMGRISDSGRKFLGRMAGKGMGVPAFWFQRGMELGSQEVMSEPYRTSVWVQSAIAKISGPISSVSPCLYEPDRELAGVKGRKEKAEGRKLKVFRTSRGVRRKAVGEEIAVPEFEDFLREPMEGMGYADFVEASVGWLKLAGELFWLLPDELRVPFPEIRKQTAGNAGLKVIVARPDKMRHVIQNGRLVGWEFKDGQGQAWTLDPEQVTHVKRYNPYDKWRGLSEYESAQVAAEGDWLAGKFSRNLMANNGDTGPYIVAKNGVPTDAQREQILADLRAKRQAQQRGDFRPIFLTGDITVEDPQVRTVDANFIAMRLNSREEIFSAFNVPPSLSQVKASYSIGSASDFYQLITGACIPTGEKFADGLERLCHRLTGREVEILLDWDEHPVMQEVRRERFASVDGFWNKGMPMEAINEFLGLEMPEFEGWDVGYLPMGVSPAGALVEPVESAQLEEPELGGDGSGGGVGKNNERPPYYDPEQEAGDDQVGEMVKALRGRISNLQQPAANGEGGGGCGCSIEARVLGKGLSARDMAQWRALAAKRLPVIKSYRSKFDRVLFEARSVVLRKVASHGAWEGKGMGKKAVASDFMFEIGDFAHKFQAGMRAVGLAAIHEGGSQVRQEIGKDDPWQSPAAATMKFVAARENKLSGVPDEVFGRVRDAIGGELERGGTMGDIERAVKAEFGAISDGRGKVIAQTETAAAVGFGRHEALREFGIEFKRWLCSGNSNVRAAHKMMNGTIQGVDEPFLVIDPRTGETDEVMHPGDADGAPWNVINCHCIEVASAEGPKA